MIKFIPNRTETCDNGGIIYNELTGTFIFKLHNVLLRNTSYQLPSYAALNYKLFYYMNIQFFQLSPSI